MHKLNSDNRHIPMSLMLMKGTFRYSRSFVASKVRSQEVTVSYTLIALVRFHCEELWNNAVEVGDLRLIVDIQFPLRGAISRRLASNQPLSRRAFVDPVVRFSCPWNCALSSLGTFDLITARNGARPRTTVQAYSLTSFWTRTVYFLTSLATLSVTSCPEGWNDSRTATDLEKAS